MFYRENETFISVLMHFTPSKKLEIRCTIFIFRFKHGLYMFYRENETFISVLMHFTP